MGDDTTKPKELRFVYEKARHHRTMYTTGAWSGLTPQAAIQIAFYNDLRRMPISVTHSIQDGDILGPATIQQAGDLIREIDVTVVMDVAVAKATIALLSQMVEQAEAITKKQQAVQESDKEKV